jgi:hypothetical protein
MIPDSKDLAKAMCPTHIQYMILNGSTYFSSADEFVTLRRIFVKDSIYETVSLWFDMIISPLLTILHALWKQTYPSFLTLLSFQKCVELWKKWLRFKELLAQIHEWKNIVRAIGGPFISSNDPEYHIFVYADAMQRLHGGLSTLIAEKRAKCFE